MGEQHLRSGELTDVGQLVNVPDTRKVASYLSKMTLRRKPRPRSRVCFPALANVKPATNAWDPWERGENGA